MAEAGYHQLKKLTECCICLKEFTEPRMLPCIHTFCLGCLKQLPYKTESVGRRGWPTRKTIPCPLCRKVFTIPSGGLDGLQKNFFMEHLMEITQNFQLCKTSTISCDICKCLYQGDEQIKTAAMRCLDCRDNFCDLCAKAHTLHKSSISHHIVKIGSETDEDLRRISPTRRCNLHNQKPLDYYCPKCRKIFCVSCVLENHATHECKDVSTVEDKFRKVIEENALKFSTYANEIFPKSRLTSVEKKKEDALLLLAKTESDIRQRQLELKEIIDKDTTTLLDELSLIKQKHVKDCENEKEEIERIHTILKSFETYCAELASKGSANDVCGIVDELNSRAIELEKDHEKFIGRPSQTIKVSFTPGSISSGNIVGRLQECLLEIKICVIIAGLYENLTTTKDVLKVNLRRPELMENDLQIPTTMRNGMCAAVYNNTLYVAGLGNNFDEIWKYCVDSGWIKCAALVQGRCRHCAVFIDEMLYICGGYANSGGTVLDSVEAYNAVSNTCKIVGKLVHCVQKSGNCVPFKDSLYIFGGTDGYNNALNYVQMYDTKQNVCTLISKPMPSSQGSMRAVLWQSTAILIGCDTCYVFDLETETWQERNRFKTDDHYFGLALENERIFVIGGGRPAPDETGKQTWTLRDDVKYIPLQSFIDDKPVEWKLYSRLKSPGLVQAYGKLEYYSPGKNLPRR